MARRTKSDSEKTRDMLLDAAEKLFLEKGIAKTCLDDIAKAAGVTRGALYWHFEDKSDLLQTMHERVKLPLDLLFSEVEKIPDPVAAMRTTTIKVLQSIVSEDRSRNVFSILLSLPNISDPVCGFSQRKKQSREEAIAKFKKVFDRIHKAGKLLPHLSSETAAIIFHACILGILSDYLSHQNAYDLTELAPVFVDVALKGLVKDYN